MSEETLVKGSFGKVLGKYKAYLNDNKTQVLYYHGYIKRFHTMLKIRHSQTGEAIKFDTQPEVVREIRNLHNA